jgi:iron complex outermembrane receptor protein
MGHSFTPTISRILAATSRAALILSIGMPGAALAQVERATASDQTDSQVSDSGAPQATPSAASEAEDIIVTASRIQRSGFTAPTPTTIIGAGAIEGRGATNIGSVLNETPQFKATISPATTAPRTLFPGAYNADLRGLGGARTLVLVDGNRFVPQIVTGVANYGVDLNQVPTLLLDRVEVVTGGASAQWGSDAVAGVVNLVLKKKFEGLEATAQSGLAEAGDFEEYRFGVLYGTKLGDRTNLLIAGDYIRNGGMGDVYQRDWGQRGFGYYANPCRVATPLSPLPSATANCRPADLNAIQNLRVEDVRYSTMTNGGLIYNTTGPAAQLRGTFFNPDGSVSIRGFQYGSAVGPGFMQGGGSNQGVNVNTGVDVFPPIRRTIGYARINHEIGDDFDIYAEGSYSRGVGNNHTLPARNDAANGAPLTISVAGPTANPYLPAALSVEIARLNALPQNVANQITAFNIGRNSTDLGYQYSTVKNITARGVAGFNGKVGDWRVAGSLTYGKNSYIQQVENGRIVRNFNFAIDAVDQGLFENGVANGNIVCRATLPGAAFNAAAAGCIPLNPFGDGSAVSAKPYVTATQQTRTIYEQTAANLSVSGDLVDLWAGPLSIATGVEYRKEKQVTTVDPLTGMAAFEASNAPPLRGTFNVKEVFGEIAVPLARDIMLLRSLELTAAGRYTDYSTSGSVTTWKVGATWSPVPGLLVRATKSRDIRAPNLFELNTPPVSTVLNQTFATSFEGGPTGNPATENRSGGNPGLEPEKSKTTTIGASYAPPFIPGLQISADYYDIKVSGTIAAANPQAIINNCLGVVPVSAAQRDQFCALISRQPAGASSSYLVINTFQNINATERRGWDFEASYRLPLDQLSRSAKGVISFRFSGNYIQRYRDDILGVVTERAGEVSGVGSPKWLTNSSINYDNALWSLGLQMRTVGKGTYNNTFVEGGTGTDSINDNTIESRTYFNLSGSIRPTDKFEFFAVVNNLTNKDPVLAPANFGFSFVPVWHDPIGRAYRVGVRLKM